MNKNTNDLSHSNRQITGGYFPPQCYLAGSWAALFPAACYICRSPALSLVRLPGHLSFPPRWQAASPLLSSPHAKLPASHRAGTSFLSFGYKPYALLTGSPLPSSVLFVLLSVCTLLSPPFDKQAGRPQGEGASTWGRGSSLPLGPRQETWLPGLSGIRIGSLGVQSILSLLPSLLPLPSTSGLHHTLKVSHHHQQRLHF